MQNKKIIFLASDCEPSKWVYNALIKDTEVAGILLEKPVSRKTLIKGRIRKVGLFPVIGQVLFSLLLVPILKIMARKRKAALVNQYQLDDRDFTPDKTYRVASVNDDACKQLLQQLNPDIIVVNGTRIISKRILQSVNAVFINMHVGITPAYRGSHGGYWAVYNNDLANFGTTIHLVDSGVDTGSVLKQAFIKPAKDDNFATFPILQVAIGIKALKEVLAEMQAGIQQPVAHKEKGKMYYQPSIIEYFGGLFKHHKITGY
jgi:folate-dependent phosphoribosylglycinamide formyltransferase PurN